MVRCGSSDASCRREIVFEETGELLLPDGEIGAEGYGKYIKLPLEKIADFDFEEQEWKVTQSDRDPTEFEMS